MIAPLAEAMQALGLKGDVSQSGRWIRFPNTHGLFCVVEAAWGGGYFAFIEPTTNAAQEIYLDPLVAIRAGLQIRLGP